MKNRILSLVVCSFLVALSAFGAKLPILQKQEEPQKVQLRRSTQMPLGRLILENGQEELLIGGVLSFLDDKSLAQMQLLCKYFKNVVEQAQAVYWKKCFEGADEKQVNKIFEKAVKHGNLNLIKFLITNQQTKRRISSYGLNAAFETGVLFGHKDIIEFLVTNETTKGMIIFDDPEKGFGAAIRTALILGEEDLYAFLRGLEKKISNE
ncbi:MAG: hypothetical protein V1855_03570 [bacterium]